MNPEMEEKNLERMKTELAVRAVLLLAASLIAALAVYAYLSAAWFVSTHAVTGSGMRIMVEEPSASLYIRYLDEDEKSFATEIELRPDESGSKPKLYPISTPDCKTWYYASRWKWDADAERAYASAFSAAQNVRESTGAYYNPTVKDTVCAYFKVTFNLYTENGRMDIYLSPEEAIRMIYTATEGKDLKGALRLAMVSHEDGEDKLLFVYALEKEAGTGNSEGQEDGVFYCIQNGQLAQAKDCYPRFLAGDEIMGITAQRDSADSKSFLAGPNSLKLCTAEPDQGTNLSLYIWLEGTDGQTMVGVSDGELEPMNLSLALVGVQAAS